MREEKKKTIKGTKAWNRLQNKRFFFYQIKTNKKQDLKQKQSKTTKHEKKKEKKMIF